MALGLLFFLGLAVAYTAIVVSAIGDEERVETPTRREPVRAWRDPVTWFVAVGILVALVLMA